jgi:Capsule assembly protein Wzi
MWKNRIAWRYPTSRIAFVLLILGVPTIEGQSDGPSMWLFQPPSSAHALPIGSGNSPTASWPKPEFEGNPKSLGSPYVPLDSWIYPALDRLASMGLVNVGFAGLRPWTRMACAQMVVDAQEQPEPSDRVAGEVLDELAREFRPELKATDKPNNTQFQMESIYSRTGNISGEPLTDGYNFAQTQYNDFGRPYGEGWNTVNGFSAYATYGRWVVYVRGEGQTAPSVPALPLAAREFVAGNSGLPVPPATSQAAKRQFTLLDTYVGTMLWNWQISFGRQSLWWGTSRGTSLELSNNIQPIDMIRINRTIPLKLPSVLRWLGAMRTEFFLGRLAGYEFIYSPLGRIGQWSQALSDQPFIHGQNISFKPTRDFEFGFYRTTIFAGEGYPFTAHSLIASLFDTGNSPAGSADKPGKRTSGLDFSYRLPSLRNWVTFYADGYINDEFSPIAYPTWSAWHPGLYFSHFPRVSKLDLRVEGVYTDVPVRGGANAPGDFYRDGTWESGYTNNTNLIGSWVGRGGQGAQAWTNYWFNARSSLQLNFRHQKVSHEFVPNGGTLTDFGVRGDYWFRNVVDLSTSLQYERWLFPVIQPGPQRNVTASFEVGFWPRDWRLHAH